MINTCIACITIEQMIDKKREYMNPPPPPSPQVYLEECKYTEKKMQMSRFISAKLESESESDSETESKSDTELIAKLKSSSDSDSE